MLELRERYQTIYEPATRTWSGGKWKAFYDRNLSFGRIAFEEMRRRPKKICQISDSEVTALTNEQVLLQAIKVVKYFQFQGIQQSDIIGIVARNTTYLFGVLLACFFHGSAYHALNIAFGKDTTKEFLEITKPKLVFFDGQDYDKVRYAIKDIDTKIITLSNHRTGITSISDVLAFTETEDCREFEPADLENGPEQNLVILCTSGSTSTPKAVTVPNSVRGYEFHDYLTEDDVQFVPSTMDWLSGLLSITSSIVYGALRVITEEPWTPEYCLKVIEKHQVTFTILSPPSMALLVKSSKATTEALASVRYFVSGGSACPSSTQIKMQSLLKNGKLITGYGFSEIFHILTKNDDLLKWPSATGRLAPDFEVRIADETGKHLGPDETGEIWVRSSQKWLGYYADPKATSQMLDANGWHHSGDLGYFDANGFLFVVGRKKEMLKYRGMQYYPSHIEDVIAKMPEVKEVCVFGVFDELFGDVATAAVVPVEGESLTTQDVVDFVRSNIEVDYKHLHGGVILLNELPKTGTGKIDRNATKQLCLA